MTKALAYDVVRKYGEEHGIRGFLETLIMMRHYGSEFLEPEEYEAFKIVFDDGQKMFAPV